MKVKNKRAIALAFLALVLAGFSLFVYIAQGRVRFLFSAILALVWFLTLLYQGFHTKSWAEEAAASADERDVYLAMKSCQAVLRVFNLLLYAGCVLAVFVYAVGKRPEALAVAVTLCGAAVMLLILSLAASRYYEKRG